VTFYEIINNIGLKTSGETIVDIRNEAKILGGLRHVEKLRHPPKLPVVEQGTLRRFPYPITYPLGTVQII